MSKTTVDYQASRRWRELWSPLPFTNNLQIWSSVSAFGLALFALLYNFLWEWCAVIGISLPNIYGATTYPAWSVVGYILFGIIAIIGFILFVGGFASLVCLIIQALKHKCVSVDTKNIPENIKAGMPRDELIKLEHLNIGLTLPDSDSLDSIAKQIIHLKKARTTIDDFLARIGVKEDDKPKQ